MKSVNRKFGKSGYENYIAFIRERNKERDPILNKRNTKVVRLTTPEGGKWDENGMKMAVCLTMKMGIEV